MATEDRVLLDPRIYSGHCVTAAANAFRHLAHFEKSLHPKGIELRITLREAAPPDLTKEFLNYLLSMSLEECLSHGIE